MTMEGDRDRIRDDERIKKKKKKKKEPVVSLCGATGAPYSTH